jgi:phosphotriesterase-related protein
VAVTTGHVQTVLGQVSSDQLGHTMMHEHVFFDGAGYFVEPTTQEAKAAADELLTLDNLWEVRYRPFANRDNLLFDDLHAATVEVMRFAEAGGGTIVDATPRMDRAPRSAVDLAAISRATGVHIVKGCGYYLDGTYPASERVPHRSVEEIAAGIVHDLEVGVGPTGIRAGIIGEIGCSWPLTGNELKVLQAAALAQRATGAAITLHPARNEMSPIEARNVLGDSGADLTRVIIGHIDRTGFELDTKLDLLATGCVLEYDFFGWEGHYPVDNALAENALPDMPNDLGRIHDLKVLMAHGYGEQLVLSQDVSTKVQRTVFGGYGFGHILRNVVPLMLLYGIEPAEIEQVLTTTPRRLLTIADGGLRDPAPVE